MADSKITGLAALTTADPANDMLPIVDVSDNSMAASGTTKRISINNILACSPSATLASATITGDLTVRTNQLIVNSSGVGVGTTPSAWSGIGPAIQVEQASLLSESSNQLYLTANGYFAGGQWNYINNASADQYYQIAGSHVWRNGAGGPPGTAIGWSTLMTLNSTGLGVGVASPATKLDVLGNAALTGTSGFKYLYFNLATDINSVRGAKIGKNYDSPFDLNIHATTSATGLGNEAAIKFFRNNTDVSMTLDSAGNCGIGVTPSAWQASWKALDISTIASVWGNVNTSIISNNVFFDGALKYKTAIVASYLQQQSKAFQFFQSSDATPVAGGVAAFTQAMTLDASGRLLVGKTTSGFTTVGAEIRENGEVIQTIAASTDATFVSKVYSSTAAAYRFYVGLGGTVFATNTTISAISDARLKENVQDLDVGLGAILALKPRKFDWKEGKGKNIKGDRGFIAQEFEAVFPQLVDEWADPAPEGEAPYKSVRQDLIPVLVKAIQELTARVQTLEAK